MPTTSILFYQESEGDIPVLEWLQELKRRNMKGFLNCAARIDRLASYGHELRRPVADYLRDGIYELRAKHRNVQYRIFYYFEGQHRDLRLPRKPRRASSVKMLLYLVMQ